MADNDSHMEEIFVDPKLALKRPNEVIFKLAFNEKGDLGLITAYQDVDGDAIFTGISLSTNTVWLGKTPLAIKASIDPGALQNIANIFSPIRNTLKNDGTTQFEQFSPPSGQIFSAGSIRSLFNALENLRKNNNSSPNDSKYFGQPDFSSLLGPSKFSFDMNSFLDSFDAAGDAIGNTDPDNPEDEDNNLEDKDNNPPFDDDPDNLG